MSVEKKATFTTGDSRAELLANMGYEEKLDRKGLCAKVGKVWEQTYYDTTEGEL